MPARNQPNGFTVSRDCVIDGTSYTRDDVVTAATAAGFRKLNVLVANRTLVPDTDPHGRTTDAHGFGDAPRQHPTPTYYSPGEVDGMSV